MFTNGEHVFSGHIVSAPNVNSGPCLSWEIRWGAAGAWLVILAALTCILHAGLDKLELPGLTAWPWLLWALAGALTVADSILVLAFQRWRCRPLLGAVICLFGLTLGLESMNIRSGVSHLSSGLSEASASVELHKQLRVEAADRRAGAETRFYQVQATACSLTTPNSKLLLPF